MHLRPFQQSHHSPDHGVAAARELSTSSSMVPPPPPPAVQYSVNGGVQDVMGKVSTIFFFFIMGHRTAQNTQNTIYYVEVLRLKTV